MRSPEDPTTHRNRWQRRCNQLDVHYDVLSYRHLEKGVSFANSFYNSLNANYKILSCNLGGTASNFDRLILPYEIKIINGLSVAFIGVSDTDTFSKNDPYINLNGIAPVVSTGDARITALLATRALAAAKGAKAFVALVNASLSWPLDSNGNQVTTGNPVGDIMTIASDSTLQGKIDIVLGGRSVISWTGMVGTTLVNVATYGLSNYGRIQFYYNAILGAVQIKNSVIVNVAQATAASTLMANLLKPYSSVYYQTANRVISMISDIVCDFDTGRANIVDRCGENTLGNMWADAFKTVLSVDGSLYSVWNSSCDMFPVMNPTFLPQNNKMQRNIPAYQNAPGYMNGPNYTITMGDIRAASCTDEVLTISITAAQLYIVVETAALGGYIYTMGGFTYTVDMSQAAGSAVTNLHCTATGVYLNRADNNTVYKIAVGAMEYSIIAVVLNINPFSNSIQSGMTHIDILIKFFALRSYYSPAFDGRINNTTPSNYFTAHPNIAPFPITGSTPLLLKAAICNYQAARIAARGW